MVAEMLHTDPATVAGLAGTIEPHTCGNPYETVELLNALRRDGLLTATAAGWRWDEAAVHAHLGRSGVASLLAGARCRPAGASPGRWWRRWRAWAGGAELSLLPAATSKPADVVDQALAPALDDGLLVAEPGAHPAVRFRHDGIREAVLSGLEPKRRRALQLAVARRLATVPELFAAAAEQYLPAVGSVADAAERRQVGWTCCAAPAGGFWPRAGLRPALKTLARRCPVPVDLQVHARSAACREPVEVSAYYIDRRGADQRGQARARLGRHGRPPKPTRQTPSCASTVRDDGACGADFTPRHRPGSASRTGWRRSAAGSSSESPPGEGTRPCAQRAPCSLTAQRRRLPPPSSPSSFKEHLEGNTGRRTSSTRRAVRAIHRRKNSAALRRSSLLSGRSRCPENLVRSSDVCRRRAAPSLKRTGEIRQGTSSRPLSPSSRRPERPVRHRQSPPSRTDLGGGRRCEGRPANHGLPYPMILCLQKPAQPDAVSAPADPASTLTQPYGHLRTK